MRALVKTEPGPGSVSLRDGWPRPVARPGWVVVEVDACGVCGTDLHILAGEHKNWPPVVLGHEYTGRITDLGPAVDAAMDPGGGAAVGGAVDWSVGDRVVCEQHTLACGRCFSCRTGAIHLCPHKRSPGWGIDGAFADAVALPVHLLHRVPDAVSPRAAAVTEPTAICVTALDRAALRGGESVVVIGPGPVGLLCALLARAQGAGSVLLVGRSSSVARLSLAASLGIATATSDEVDVAALVSGSTAGRGADVVLETSGSEQGLDQAISWARRAGRVVCVGITGRPTIAVPVDEAMTRSLTLSFSMSSEYSTWDRALALMATGALDPVPLTTVYDLGDWEQAFADIEARHVVKALLTPRPLP